MNSRLTGVAPNPSDAGPSGIRRRTRFATTRTGRRSPDCAAHALLEAVHYAHALGLQQRDLKPSNIMLDAQLSPRILDFGLSGGNPARGHLKGTLPYVAPEQLDPARPIDARTDIYALGVILYELLCGSAPYWRDAGTLLTLIAQGQPTLPMLNLGAALYLVADHRLWFGRPGWAIALIVGGLVALGAGLTLDRSERRG